MGKVRKVFVDTNFLIDLGRFGISIDEIDKILSERYELCVPSSVINELKTIAGTQQEESKFAKLALMILDLRKATVIQSEKSADEALIEFSRNEKDAVVATNDGELQKKLRENKVRIISVRSKKKLEMK